MNVRTYLPSLWDRNERSPAHVGTLRQEIDKLFDDFSRSLQVPDVFSSLGRFDVVPDMDLQDTDKEVKLSIELPGVDEKDIDIIVSGQSITISGEKKSETETKDGKISRSERSYGSFSRSVSLPFRIDGDKVEATFSKGVLTVTVPKPADAIQKTKKVPITG